MRLPNLFSGSGDGAGAPRSPMRLIKWAVIGLIVVIVGFNSYTIIPTGHVGVKSTLGSLDPQPLENGFHLVNPLASVEKIDTRLITSKPEAHSGSHDLQKVTTYITVPFSVVGSQAPRFYAEIGDIDAFKAKILEPGIQETVKAVTANYTAVELVTKRDAVRVAIEDVLKQYVAEALENKGVPGAVQIGFLTVDNLTFTPKFQQAIEAKVKAGQDAERAVNEGKKIVTEAEGEASRITAQADGEAYQILELAKKEADAIRREAAALRSNPDLIELTAIQRWKGRLPRFSGVQALPTLPVGPSIAAPQQ